MNATGMRSAEVLRATPAPSFKLSVPRDIASIELRDNEDFA